MAKTQTQRAAAAPSNAVGERLKLIRQDTGLTLSEVAQRTGVSISNLSKIERGEVSPSFDVVMRICEGLDIALEQFVTPGPKIGVSGRKTRTLRGDAVPFATDQYDYLAHASEISRKGMVPLEMWVKARSAGEFSHWSQHEGEELVFVISGEIEIHTDQYEPFRIKAGESAYFDSNMRHIYVSVGEGSAHILSVSYNPNAAAAPLERFMNPAVRPGLRPLEVVPTGEKAATALPVRKTKAAARKNLTEPASDTRTTAKPRGSSRVGKPQE